jgi:metallo-beta-lactamase class B
MLGPGLALAALAVSTPVVAATYADPTWTQSQAPFRIVGNIYYVGSKGLGAYLITSPEGHILIDGTVAENAPLIEANITSLGFNLRDVKILMNNHAHHDHAGALAQLKKDTGAQMLASPGDVWALEHGQPRGDNTVHPPSFPPVKVDRLLRDGEVVRLGPIALGTVFTPGHTPGCTSWTMDVVEPKARYRVLFLCSVTVAGNVLVGNKAYPAIVNDYRKSLARLRDFNGADVVLTGHPEVADVLGRHEAELLGDPDPWGDSGQLSYILNNAAAEVDAALGKRDPGEIPFAARAVRGGWVNIGSAHDRFAVQFPKSPTVVQERYVVGGGPTVPARTWTAKDGTAVYRLTVADVAGQPVDREAVFRTVFQRLRGGGKLRTDAEARIEAVHGRQVSFEQPDGGHAIASVFITPNRVYELEARSGPSDGGPAPASLIRFQQMLNLY